jgi:hypothetical protein
MEDIMQCPEFQTENKEPRRFCRKCGAKLLIICPSCSFQNSPGDDYCGGCGQNLGDQEKTPPIKYSNPQSPVFSTKVEVNKGL